MWLSHPKWQEIVREVWYEEIMGTKPFMMSRKLKALKHPLKRLNKRAFGHITERAETTRVALEEAQKCQHDLPDSKQARMRVNQAKTQVVFLDKVESSFYYHKAKCSYIREGDRSKKKFHSLCGRNVKKKYVASLQRSGGSRKTSTAEVLDEFMNFYRKFWGPGQSAP